MNFDFRQKPIKFHTALIAIILGLLVGAVLIIVTGHNPIEIYGYMLKGAIGSSAAIASTLRWSTPLLLTGLAAMVAFRGGMFNFGIEGQLYVGALAAALVGVYLKGVPPILHILVAIIAAMIAGIIWAILPALVRAKFGETEVVPALMLNYVAMYLCDYLVQRFFLPNNTFGQTMATDTIDKNIQLPKLIPPYSLNTGFLIALTMIIIVWFMFKYTRYGYNVSMCGLNSEFARYGGINVNAIRFDVMLISGAIAGMCGAIEVLGITWRYESGFSPDFGIEGILASLLGGNQPFGLLIGSIFMGAVKAGSLTVERSAGVPRALADVIKAFIICFVSAQYLASYLGLDRIVLWFKERHKIKLFSNSTKKREGV